MARWGDELVLTRTSSTTTIRSNRPARPEDGYHLADDMADKAVEFIRDAKVIDPDKPFFMYLAPQAGHAPHLVPLEWADRYKGVFDQGYEAIRAGILERQIDLGLLPEGTQLSPINPHGEPVRTGPEGQPWPLLDTVRPWDSLNADERRLFAAHGRSVRRLHLLLRPPAGTGPRLSRGVGPARQHHHRGRLRQRCQRRGGSERQLQRMALLQRRARHDRNHAAPHRRARYARPRTTTTTPAGRGRSTRPSPTGSAGRAPRAAWPTCASSRGRPGSRLRPRCVTQYIHAVDIVPTIYELLGIEPPDVLKGYRQTRSRARASRPHWSTRRPRARTTQFYAMLGQRSIYHEGWLACTVHPPLSGWGHFDRDEWELFHLDEDRAQTHEPRHERTRATRTLKGLWFYYAGRVQRAAPRRPHGARAGPRRAPAGRRTTGRVHLLPGLCRRPRVRRTGPQRPVLHHRRRRADRLPRRRGRASGPPAAYRAATASTSRTAAPLHVQLDRHHPPRRVGRP